jgi:hypothetical protein
MAWWDDAAEAVGSGVGWLGDAAEAVVDTATEVVEEVTESGSDAADAGLDALRDGAASVGPALGAVANVVLGVVKGAVHAVADLTGISLDIVRNVGKLVSDVLHLNLADIIGDLGNILLNVLQLIFVWLLAAEPARPTPALRILPGTCVTLVSIPTAMGWTIVLMLTPAAVVRGATPIRPSSVDSCWPTSSATILVWRMPDTTDLTKS